MIKSLYYNLTSFNSDLFCFLFCSNCNDTSILIRIIIKAVTRWMIALQDVIPFCIGEYIQVKPLLTFYVACFLFFSFFLSLHFFLHLCHWKYIRSRVGSALGVYVCVFGVYYFCFVFINFTTRIM